MSTLKQNTGNTEKARVLGFQVAQELNTEELAQVSGGRMSDDPRQRSWNANTDWSYDED